MRRYDDYELVTFDCYGTLIDWEKGIVSAIKPVLQTHGMVLIDEAILAMYARLESQAEAGAFKPYRKVLRQVMTDLGRELEVDFTASELECLADSVGEWPPFADTMEALKVLKSRYKLAILSNIDQDLIAKTLPNLGVEFDWIVTAQDVNSYKPGQAHFHEILKRSQLPVEKVLHVAQSLYHDIGVAGSMGFATVWVNRRQGKPGSGATPDASAQPNVEVPDLRTLANLVMTAPAAPGG